MCIIFLHIGELQHYKLIVAFNRDEVIDRRTQQAYEWEGIYKGIIAGKDLEGATDGTWLGVQKSGKFGALLNVNSKVLGIAFNPDRASRGRLVTDYLLGSISAENYMEKIQGDDKLYNFFNLVMGDFSGDPEVKIYDYYQNKMVSLPSGISCFGNLPPEWSNKRAEYGQKLFSEVISEFASKSFTDKKACEVFIISELMNLLYNNSEVPDSKNELFGSFKHVYNESYFVNEFECGSVSSTVLLVDNHNNCTFIEESNFNSGEIKKFQWKIE